MSLATVSAWPDVPSESAIGDTSKAAQLVETSKDTSRLQAAGPVPIAALTGCVLVGTVISTLCSCWVLERPGKQ